VRIWANCSRPTSEFARKFWDGSAKLVSISNALAAQLQNEGAESSVKSWNDLTGVISSKAAALGKSTTPEAVS
jgi:hypothetical protein